MKTIGIIILLIGLGLTFFTGFTYFTKEKIVDIGKIEIVQSKAHHFNMSLMVGIVVMGVGGGILWISYKK